MKFKRKKPLYSDPKAIKDDDIEKGLEELFAKQKGSRKNVYIPPKQLQQGQPRQNMNIPNPLGRQQDQPTKFNAPNEWGVKSLNLSQHQQQQPTRQARLGDFGMQQPQQPQQQQQQPAEEESEPYWSAEEWEAWAYQMAVNYPETQQFLPEWFMQALQDSE